MNFKKEIKMKKIVMLDIFPCEEKDFAFLEKYGEYTLYERTNPAEVKDRICDAEIILTNKTKLNETDFSVAKKLQYVGVTATGHNIVDSAAAKKRGITVTNIPTYGTDSVAQHTFALLLELTNHVGAFFADIKGGVWANSPGFCAVNYPLLELNNKTLGIIGFGAIGQKVAQIAKAFGMKIKVHSRSVKTNCDVTFCNREELFKTCDVITLHCPSTPETNNIINSDTLKMMKKTALLLNTSRGDLIDESALCIALKSGVIGGAALDVLAEEPPQLNHPLNQLSNCILTPHVAWSGTAARARILEVTQENLAAFIEGRSQNVVNKS